MDEDASNYELVQAYRLAFGSPAGQKVLMDLAPFCRAYETCFDADPRRHAWLEGRREVWLRIQDRIHLTPEELVTLRRGFTIRHGGMNE